MKDKKEALLGTLHSYLRETLNLIFERGKITAGELSNALKLPANTSGTRLLNLYKKKLVKRTEEVRDTGRIWVYEKI